MVHGLGLAVADGIVLFCQSNLAAAGSWSRAVSGAIAGPIVELDVRTLYLKDLSFFGCTVLEPQVFGNLVKLIEAGRIKPLV